MTRKNTIIPIGRILLITIIILSMTVGVVAGEDGTYYYSDKGNNIDTIMYTEVDWQNCNSAKMIFLTKYDIASGDGACMFCSNDLKTLTSWTYTGTKSDWTSNDPEMIDISEYIGYKYIGFWYNTDDSDVGDGFFVDQIQLYSSDLDRNLLFDDGNSGNGLWVLEGGFTLIDGSSTWNDEWMGPDSDGGSAITTPELQNAIYNWLEDISVGGHLLTIEDIQGIIALWLL
jgi:hypothetical protein